MLFTEVGMSSERIEFYGAEWCGDCRRTKKLLESLQVPFVYNDVEHDEAAMAKAIEISGVQSIPVVVFDDGTFFVEPSDPQMREKLEALGIITS